MTAKRLFLITILMVLFCSILEADKAEDAYQKMITAYSKLTTWQAVINQTNYYIQTKTTLKSTGNFYYQKGKIAIKYNKPNEQSLLIRNGVMTMYDKSSNTAMETSLVSAVQSLNPVEIIKTYWQKSTKTCLPGDAGFTSISIVPKSDKQIKEIKAQIDAKSGYITQLIYIEKQGNSVTITFNKLVINKPIQESAWKLNIPKNANILKR